MAKAISPSEVTARKSSEFPDFVFDVFNSLIAVNYNHSNREAKIEMRTAMHWLIQAGAGSEADVREKGYLEIEDVYEAAGWEVQFCKPDYTENWPAYYRFRRPKG